MTTTAQQAKIEAARDCIREHLSHVGGLYGDRAEALAAARTIISRSEKLDSTQIAKAFESFDA